MRIAAVNLCILLAVLALTQQKTPPTPKPPAAPGKPKPPAAPPAPDPARPIAEALAKHAAGVENVAVKTDVDTAKPSYVSVGEFAVMVIPDKRLKMEWLKKPATGAQPVGQLWFYKLTPTIDGQAVSNDRLNMVKVTLNKQDLLLPFVPIGLELGADGKAELHFYAKDKVPLAKLPLKELPPPSPPPKGKQPPPKVKPPLPVELAIKPSESATGMLKFTLLGRYEASLPVVRQP